MVLLPAVAGWGALVFAAPAAAVTGAYLCSFLTRRGGRLWFTREGGLTASYRQDLQAHACAAQERVARTTGYAGQPERRAQRAGARNGRPHDSLHSPEMRPSVGSAPGGEHPSEPADTKDV